MTFDAKFRIGVNGDVVIAPAAACLKWNTEPSGKARVIFYWGGREQQLPVELRPTLGHEQTPHLLADDAAHAKKIVAAIKAWLLEKHPDLTQKKSKEVLRFIPGNDREYQIGVYPEEERTLALDAIFGERLVPWKIADDHPAIIWRCGSGELRVRISDDQVRFENQDSVAEYAEPAKKHGTLQLDNGLLAAIAIDNTFDNLREPPKNAAALKTLAGKKPAVLKGKKGDEGDAFVAKIEKGTYEVAVGPDVEAKLRWLTLTRV